MLAHLPTVLSFVLSMKAESHLSLCQFITARTSWMTALDTCVDTLRISKSRKEENHIAWSRTLTLKTPNVCSLGIYSTLLTLTEKLPSTPKWKMMRKSFSQLVGSSNTLIFLELSDELVSTFFVLLCLSKACTHLWFDCTFNYFLSINHII